MSLIRERETLRGEISVFCKKLVLSQRAVQLCETEATPKQEEFLHRVLAEERESRERSRRARLLSRAGLPVYKTLDGYDRHGVKLPSSLMWSDLTDGTLIQGRRNLVLYGPVGTGKTHLAIATGLRACELGMTVKFYTVAELVMRLAEARRGGTLERLMSEIQRCQLLNLRRVGLHSGRQGRLAAVIPRHCRQLREPQSCDYDESRILQMGFCFYGRPDGSRDD